MRETISSAIVVVVLIAASLIALGLYRLLPYRALDTGLVYGGF